MKINGIPFVLAVLSSFALHFASLTVANAAVKVAQVGDQSITDEDIKKHLSVMSKADQNRLLKNKDTRDRLIENLVTEEILVQEAKKRNVQNDSEFKAVLEQYTRRLMAQKVLQEEVFSKMDEKNLKSYFSKNKKKFNQDEVRASHILLKTEKEADEVYALVTKKGADFGELAKKHSTDPTAQHNLGDLGYFTRARMVPEFSDAAFSMSKGKISKPVKSQFGYHIIKVVDKKQGKPVKFEDVVVQVRQDYQKTKIEETVDRLKKKSKVEVFDKNLEKIKL